MYLCMVLYLCMVRGAGFGPAKALRPQDLKSCPLDLTRAPPQDKPLSNVAIKLAPFLVGPAIDRAVLLALLSQLSL